MRFLVDECTGPGIAKWLRELGHDVFSVSEQLSGVDDETLLKKAFDENWILISNDKDFGEKVHRDHFPHRGVILLRLENKTLQNRLARLQLLFDLHSDTLAGRFIVVTENKIRIS